jgi:uncharacterized protein
VPLATTTAASPVAPATRERMDVLDAVRGAAVLGILFVNIESLTGYSFTPPSARAALPLAEWDHAAERFVGIFIEAKFYALFSLLFGIGFAVFVDRAAVRGDDAVGLFRRRLTGLLLIGLTHTLLIWFGDILVTYALLGFGLVFFLHRSDRSLLRWAIGLLLLPAVLYLAAAVGVALFAPADSVASGPGEPLPPVLATAVDALARGSYPQVVAANAVLTLANAARRLGLMFFPRVFAMFLLGLLIGRRRVLEDLASRSERLRRVALWGTVVGLPLAIAGEMLPEHLPLAGTLVVEAVARSIAIPALTLAYGAGLCLLFRRAPVLMRAFAGPGRMALTNYLLHSVAGVVAFYGVGFGLFGRLSLVSGIAVGIAFFLLQMVLSRLWLSRAAFGPAEWLWRMFTYRRRFPLFIRPDAA